MHHQHQARHHAQDARDQRDRGAKARVLFHLDVEHDIANARDRGQQAVKHHQAGQRALRAGEGENAQQDQQNTDNQLIHAVA